MQNKHFTISIPRHPADAHIPDSVLHIPLPSGKIVTVVAPLFSESMGMLIDTLKICKPAIVMPEPDYEI